MIDEQADTDRIVAYLGSQRRFSSGLFGAVFSRAVSRGKKMFVFFSDPDLLERSLTSGFTERPGFITVNVADWHLLASALGVKGSPAGEFERPRCRPAKPLVHRELATAVGRPDVIPMFEACC